jgi:hypothetical protein
MWRPRSRSVSAWEITLTRPERAGQGTTEVRERWGANGPLTDMLEDPFGLAFWFCLLTLVSPFAFLLLLTPAGCTRRAKSRPAPGSSSADRRRNSSRVGLRLRGGCTRERSSGTWGSRSPGRSNRPARPA